MKKALIVVDYQYDFAHPLGKLYVPQGELIKKEIENKIIEYKNNGDYVIFSGDFHPQKHVSFKQWPEHCVVGSKGAEFFVDSSNVDLIIKKGTKLEYDSYSAFYISKDTKNREELNVESQLDSWLKNKKIEDLEICGLALDVCVQATYDDAIKKGYKSVINYNLCKKIK
ncbi:isochorismatase family protein [Spiroplasma cantharicola]|uniref:nicotinamidase n=1 Tax=Spiroplasma cantharicola TaxID=362837 RepID=A0A0M3SJ66_9MOLU|nr:isochorismatase family protein [Spiroplasma cantharicola]ALD66218.1 pyrazinamidase/nicotinamidase [Spiroplasma cantharicola]